jgi:hypothetical protein
MIDVYKQQIAQNAFEPGGEKKEDEDDNGNTEDAPEEDLSDEEIEALLGDMSDQDLEALIADLDADGEEPEVGPGEVQDAGVVDDSPEANTDPETELAEKHTEAELKKAKTHYKRAERAGNVNSYRYYVGHEGKLSDKIEHKLKRYGQARGAAEKLLSKKKDKD